MNRKLKTVFLLPVLCHALTVNSQETAKDSPYYTSGKTALDSSRVQIVLNWDKTYQEIQGFGAFGGRILPFFESPKRDIIMEHLLGDRGLRLNILRGEILHTYPFDKENGRVTIKPPGVDINVDPESDDYQQLTSDQKEHLAQVWILKKAKENYKLPIAFASAWTPPLYMKTDTSNISARGFNGIDFPRYAADFANYIAGFANAFQKEGVDLYAISPTNEPDNILDDWAASYWTPGQLGKFISGFLRPALNSRGLNDTKIMAAEASAWGTANSILTDMDKTDVDILAGHGYVEIADFIFGKKGLNQRPVPWRFDTENKPVWLTETSDDSGSGYDSTMQAGLHLATSMHKFLAERNVNAFIYWLGMLDFKNQEALICTNKDDTLDFPRTYDVMGQFSRYVHAGYIRFDVNVVDEAAVKVSAYKNPETGEFSIVAINPGNKEIKCTLQLKGVLADKLNWYITADGINGHWQKGISVKSADSENFDVIMPPMSVITYTGTDRSKNKEKPE